LKEIFIGDVISIDTIME